MTSATKKKKTTKKKGTVSPVKPKSSVKEFYNPSIVKTKIVADEDDFMPRLEDNHAVLKANVAPDHAGNKVLTLTHRTTQAVDCGISIKNPAGYKCDVCVTDEWARRGLVVTQPWFSDEGGRVTVVVTNIGKEIIVIKDRDEIANLSISPMCLFDWLKVENF